MSLVDPFEALRAYANGDRPPLADIVTSPSLDERDVALRALAAGCISFDFLQKSPLSDSPLPSSDIGGGTTPNFFPAHGRDVDRPRFASYRMNAKSTPSSNGRSRDHTREFHVQLAAMNLERGQRTVRVPADVDLGYIRFREVLKQSLTDKGDECIWRGLEMRDEPRLRAIDESDGAHN